MNDLKRVRVKISAARERLAELEAAERVLEEIASETPDVNGAKKPTGVTGAVFALLEARGEAVTADVIKGVEVRIPGSSPHSVRSILSLCKKRGKLGRKDSGEWFIMNGDKEKRPQEG